MTAPSPYTKDGGPGRVMRDRSRVFTQDIMTVS